MIPPKVRGQPNRCHPAAPPVLFALLGEEDLDRRQSGGTQPVNPGTGRSFRQRSGRRLEKFRGPQGGAKRRIAWSRAPVKMGPPEGKKPRRDKHSTRDAGTNSVLPGAAGVPAARGDERQGLPSQRRLRGPEYELRVKSALTHQHQQPPPRTVARRTSAASREVAVSPQRRPPTPAPPDQYRPRPGSCSCACDLRSTSRHRDGHHTSSQARPVSGSSSEQEPMQVPGCLDHITRERRCPLDQPTC